MELKSVSKLVDERPDQRALTAIELGHEMKAPKRRKLAVGTLPPAVDFAEFHGNMKHILKHLHGIRVDEPEKATGMRGTGRSLETKVGTIDDMVLTPRHRKNLANTALKKRTGETNEDVALRHLATGMFDPSIAPRVCSAHAYWRATGAAHVATPVLVAALEHAQDEGDHLLAAHALAQVDASKVSHLVGDDMTPRAMGAASAAMMPSATGPAEKESMTVIIHGTFASGGEWYKPGGSFHKYIKEEVYPDVYSGDDFYKWSGAYGTENMLKRIWETAAKALVTWVKAHPARTIRLMAHSHGNNVVNRATHLGLPTSCTLIQMGPPVRDWNLPDMSKVSSARLFSIYASRDLVITLDGGAVTYAGTATEAFEKKRKVATFDHSYSHEKKAWQKKNLVDLVTTVCPP